MSNFTQELTLERFETLINSFKDLYLFLQEEASDRGFEAAEAKGDTPHHEFSKIWRKTAKEYDEHSTDKLKEIHKVLMELGIMPYPNDLEFTGTTDLFTLMTVVNKIELKEKFDR